MPIDPATRSHFPYFTRGPCACAVPVASSTRVRSAETILVIGGTGEDLHCRRGRPARPAAVPVQSRPDATPGHARPRFHPYAVLEWFRLLHPAPGFASRR